MSSKLKTFFLENKSLRQTIFKNTFWLFLAELIARLAGLVLAIYIARVLGVTEYGKFTFALSFVFIVAIFSELGIIDTFTREFSRDRENERKISEIFTLEILLSIVTLIISIISSFFITNDELIRRAIFILTFFILSNSFLGVIFAVLRARQKMEYESAIKILQALASLLLVFFVVLVFPSVINLSYAYLVSNLVILIATLALFHFYFQPIKLVWKKGIFTILKKSWPLSLGFMAAWFYIYIDSVMLGSFGLITENGWYNAACKIAIAAVIPATLILRSFYPALSSFFVSSKEKLQRSWDYLSESMIFLAIPIVVGGVMLAPEIIRVFYGENFLPSIVALQLLIFVTGISFISFPYSVALVVAGYQRKNFYAITLGGLLNIILNFIFIPVWNLYGAIISTIVSLVAVFLITFIFTKRLTSISVFNKKLLRVFAISGFSTLMMYLFINFLSSYNTNVLLVCFAAGALYFLIAFVLYRFLPRRHPSNNLQNGN